MLNRQVVLKSHPKGVPLPEDFELIEGSMAEPGDGQMLVRNLFFSFEAAIRGWLDGKANYFEPIPLGGAIRGPSVARVVTSHLGHHATPGVGRHVAASDCTHCAHLDGAPAGASPRAVHRHTKRPGGRAGLLRGRAEHQIHENTQILPPAQG